MRFRSNINRNMINTGDHKIDLSNTVFKHFKDDDSLRDKLFDTLVEHINKVDSNIPDYDSGYGYVEGSTTYDIIHNIGTVPTRFVCYISASEKPKFESEDIYLEDGITIKNITNKKVRITTPVTMKNGNTTGFLRILIWR